MEKPEPGSPRRRFVLRLAAVLIGWALALAVLAIVALSPLPMRGAEIFGALFNKIKGHPGATAFWIFTGLGVLWSGVAMTIGIQEWRAVRRRT